MNTFEDVPFDETDLALWGIGKLIKLWRLFQVHPSSQSFFSFHFLIFPHPLLPTPAYTRSDMFTTQAGFLFA